MLTNNIFILFLILFILPNNPNFHLFFNFILLYPFHFLLKGQERNGFSNKAIAITV